MITAQEVHDWTNRPVPASVAHIENGIKRCTTRMVCVKLIDADENPLIVLQYAVEFLMTTKGTLRADIRKLVKPHLPNTARISVTEV